jgi:DNA-binding transcriptional LysR family regulator
MADTVSSRSAATVLHAVLSPVASETYWRAVYSVNFSLGISVIKLRDEGNAPETHRSQPAQRLLGGHDRKERDAGGIRPTERAKALWQSMQHPLEELRALAVPSEFTPATTVMTFNVAVTDTLLSRVLPLLATRLMAQAPMARLVMHYHSNPASIAGLEAGQLDCAAGMFPSFSPDIIVETVATDDYVAVFRAGHPQLTPDLTLGDFLTARHVLVKQSFRQLGMVDAWMKLRGLEREVVVTVQSSADALEVVRTSDLVAAVPLTYVRHLGSHSGVAWAELPFPHDHISYKLAWHERTDRDQARMWLRRLVRECIEEAVTAVESARRTRQRRSVAVG